MKIFVTGTRGIPDIPGGVERHCEQLYPLIAESGVEVAVATRKPYVTRPMPQWEKIRLAHLFAPRKKSFEAIVHTFLAVCKARVSNADIVHIHGVGPWLMVPFARLLGLKVVATNHGPDYDRQKWGRTARMMLRLGEYLGGRFAHSVIVISETVGEIVRRRCDCEPVLIPNGVKIPEKSKATDYLERIGVRSSGYILAVSRLVPEKGLDLLIDAFEEIDSHVKLVIAGDADHQTEYSRKIKARIAANPDIVSTGYITGEPLRQVYSHARLFVLPSYHEGLPIALLEALSFDLPVVVSDIPAHWEIGLNAERYFAAGDAQDLKEKIQYHLTHEMPLAERQALRTMLRQRYDWSQIAARTAAVYRSVLDHREP